MKKIKMNKKLIKIFIMLFCNNDKYVLIFKTTKLFGNFPILNMYKTSSILYLYL